MRGARAVGLTAVLATGLLAGATAAAPPDPSSLVLLPSQVGKGYTLERPEGGMGLGLPTLDLCRLPFPSERRRRSRVQVVYLPPAGSGRPSVSNEVVAYAPGGAAQAVSEVVVAASRCPKTPIVDRGVASTYRVGRVGASGLPAGSAAFSVEVTARSQGKTRRLQVTVFYLRRGDTLSGVYVYGGQAAVRDALARTLARASLAKLAQSVRGQAA